MKAKFIIITIILLLSGATISTSSAQNLIAEYNFDGDLLDALEGSTLSKFSTENDGYNHNNATFGYATDAVGSYSYWTSSFERGGGLWVDVNTDISTNYSVGIRFSFENTTTSYRKIIDFKNMNSDNGFYFYSGGHLNFYPDGALGNSITQDNQVVDIIITRSSDNAFKAYIVVNNILINELNIADNQGNAIAEKVGGKPRFRFFHDDILTSGEATPGGKVYSIKIWDGPITDIGLAMNNSWTGTVNSDWNSTSNWSKNSIPVSSEDVVIPDANSTDHDPVINLTSAECNNLTINSNGILTMNSGKALTINGDLSNSGTFTINSTGSLITNGTITNSGTINIQQNISENAWHLISSPNSVTIANTFLGDYLQTWNESTATWSDIINVNTPLTPVQGYSLWATLSENATYTFSGTPNTGPQSIAVTANGSGGMYNNANLLGNPYPSSIDWSGPDDTWGAVYYWNGVAYESWIDGAGSGSQFVAPMQGFFIVANSAGIFNLSNSNRTHSGAAIFYKSSRGKNKGIVLQASNGSYNDDLYLIFDEIASEGFDLQQDAYKFLSGSNGISEIYSLSGDKMLSVDTRPACDAIQLGFKNEVSGTYTIAAKEINDLQYVTLEDSQTGIFTSLAENAYTFDFETGENELRFKLHFSALGIDDNRPEVANIYCYHNTVFINLKNQVKGDIFIYNISGQLVANVSSATGTNRINLANAGNYIVKVISDKATIVKKVFIQ